MALARAHVWNAGDLLKAADLNGEFNNILNNPISLISPTTGVITFSTAQTFPATQLISTKTDAGAAVSLTTAGLHTEGTIAIPGTAPLRFSSTTAVVLAPGALPLKTTSGNWVWRAVPSNITLSATSTGGSTGGFFSSGVFYVYALDSSGATNLIFATTGAMPHSASTENGVEVATTDANKTLVGMVRLTASTHFNHVSSERFVATWYGRGPVNVRYVGTASPYTNAATTYVEVGATGTQLRAHFVTWGDPLLVHAGGGDASNSGAGGFVFVAIGLDGANTLAEGAGGGQSANAGSRFFYSAVGSFTSAQATEGYHFVVPAFRVNAGTGTLTGGSPEQVTIQTMVTV